MSDNDAGWEAKGGRVTVECQSLLALATPEMFQENAFRITGLPVDATTREIARHLDKLKMMEELGQGESVHTAAFALSPPPGVDQIRDAMQCLRDPERRILDELFWFWPATFGASGKDPAIQALAGGDRNTALGIWLDREEAAATDLVATHNLAVLWQLVALEWEDYADHEEIDAERRKKIANYWQRSFDRWERLATNDVFWESIGGRAKQLDESRLSTGFVYRVRSALPSALDKIHAELAVRYAGKNRMELAGVHAQFLRARKVDPVEKMKTAELVLAPTTARIKQQIERVRLPLPKPEEGIRISQELLGQVQRTFPLYDLLLGEGSEMRNDLSDEVVEVVNRQIVQYEKATRDFETCAQIGRLLRPLAVASHWVKLIDENIGIWVGQRLLETIRPICETTVRCTGVANAAAQIAQLDATVRKIMLEPIYREASIAAARQAQDEVALTIARCAGTYGRLTLFWDVAGRYLQDSLKWAESAEVKQQVTDLIADAHKKADMFRGMRPVTSTPGLSRGWIGLAFIGRCDFEAYLNSYLTTHYLTVLGIPLFPLSRYRVIREGVSYRILAKGPLRTGENIYLCATILALLVGLFAMMMGSGTPPPQTPSLSEFSHVKGTRPVVNYGTPAVRRNTPPLGGWRPSTPTPFTSLPAGTYHVPNSMTVEFDREKQVIDAEKATMKKMEDTLRALGDEADAVRRNTQRYSDALNRLGAQINLTRGSLNHADAASVDAFNRQVDTYNQLAQQQRSLNSVERAKVDQYNQQLAAFRAQEQRVNQLVDAYNARLRQNSR